MRLLGVQACGPVDVGGRRENQKRGEPLALSHARKCPFFAIFHCSGRCGAITVEIENRRSRTLDQIAWEVNSSSGMIGIETGSLVESTYAKARASRHLHPMKLSTRKCVKCGTPLRNGEIVVVGPFPCPSCHTQLQAAESYVQIAVWGGVLISIAVFYLAGLRGLRLACAVLIAFMLVVFVVANILKYLVPPKIENYLPRDSTLRLRD
jgi:hypothetical protein